ncbi:MAG: hypothetical protein R3B36_02540 [Polyangiaceae bacterium]
MLARRDRHVALALAGALATAAGCTLSVTGTLPVAEPPPPAEAGVPDASLPSPGDAAEAPDAPPSTGAAVVLAAVGGVDAPTGYAQQTHLVYAVNAQRWWLFTFDDAAPDAIRTRSSVDFVTWQAGPEIPLPHPHGKHGGFLSVAYADVGAVDVVHVAAEFYLGTVDQRHYHARVTLSGAALAYGAFELVSRVGDALMPAAPIGPVALVTPAGGVVDGTGYSPYFGNPATTANMNAYSASTTELGTSWTPGFGPREDVGSVPFTVHTRAFAALGGSDVLAVWESADGEPKPTNLRWARRTNGVWGGGVTALPASATLFGANDWSLARLGDADVHVVRRAGDDYVHRRYDGAAFVDGQVLSKAPASDDAGLVLLHDGVSRVMAVTLGPAPDHKVIACTWSAAPAPSWGPWRELVSAPAERSFVSGYASGGRAAVIWTERDAAGSKVVGRTVSF